jgi:hypothetical protein
MWCKTSVDTGGRVFEGLKTSLNSSRKVLHQPGEDGDGGEEAAGRG